MSQASEKLFYHPYAVPFEGALSRLLIGEGGQAEHGTVASLRRFRGTFLACGAHPTMRAAVTALASKRGKGRGTERERRGGREKEGVMERSSTHIVLTIKN